MNVPPSSEHEGRTGIDQHIKVDVGSWLNLLVVLSDDDLGDSTIDDLGVEQRSNLDDLGVEQC